MKLKLINKVCIFAGNYKITYNPQHDGGKFSMADTTIEIGIRSMDKDPMYTLSTISHEIMEIIYCAMGVRYDSSRTGENYLFNFNHQEFENSIQVHTQLMSQFLA